MFRQCREYDLPDHVRRQTFTGLRWDLSAAIGLGKGLQIGVSLPVQMKRFTITHELLDGTPYTVPYPLRSGSTGAVFGLGDLRVNGRVTGRVPSSKVLLDATVGVALPTGRTSPNPFDPDLPASQGQPRQFGNGTVDPLVEVGAVIDLRPVGLLVRGTTRVPLYANKHGYRGQLLLGGSFGVLATLPAPLQTLRLLALADLSHAGAARWDGAVAPNSGRDAVALRLGFEWSITPKFALRGQLVSNLLETLEGDQFSAPFGLGLGVSGVIDLKKDKH